MEAFSLLKYWKGGAAAQSRASPTPTTVLSASASASHLSAADSDEGADAADAGDDGPFFDLEIAVPDDDETPSSSTAAGAGAGDENEAERDRISAAAADALADANDSSDDEEDGVSIFSGASSGDGSGNSDQNPAGSPSDDLFFKGKLVPLEPSADPNSKNPSPVSILNPAAKFRFFLLRFKRPKPPQPESSAGGSTSGEKSPEIEAEPEKKPNGKFLTVKLKVEEVPIVSLFTRESSSRASTGEKRSPEKQGISGEDDDRKISRDQKMQRYLKMVKPLYVRVSKRYGEKLRFSGQLTDAPPPAAPEAPGAPKAPAAHEAPATEGAGAGAAEETDGPPAAASGNGRNLRNIPAGLRVVCKRLGKSRSASAAVAAAPAAAAVVVATKRRDDSLLEQQDGIQSAILHCKRSFNGSRDSGSGTGTGQLSRSSSDPSNEKSMDLSRKSSEESAKAAMD